MNKKGERVLHYAIRNILRLKAKSVICLITFSMIFFLSVFGFFMRALCEDSRARFWGPLDGSVHVTNETLDPYLTYDAAATLANDADVITRVSAVKEYTGFFRDALYVGYGNYKRAQFSGEEPTPDRKTDYLKGISLVGVTSMEILKEVYGGDLKVIAGEMITDKDTVNKIVVSEEFARANGLGLGDSLTLDTLSMYQTEYEAARFRLTDLYNQNDFTYEYVIGGIYSRRTDNAAAVSLPWELNTNTVYVPMASLEAISRSEGVQRMFLSGDVYALKTNPALIPDMLYFHLSDIGESEALEAEINRIGFSRTVKLTEYVSDISTSPSARLSGIVSAVLAFVMIVGFAILILTVSFNMKTRQRELAMLVALGKQRTGVTLAYFLEMALLIVCALFLSFALLTFGVVQYTAPLSEYLYSAEVSAQFQSESAELYLFGTEAGTDDFGFPWGFSALVWAYLLPSIAFAGIITAGLFIFLYLIIYLYVRRIHPLYDIGGKE